MSKINFDEIEILEDEEEQLDIDTFVEEYNNNADKKLIVNVVESVKEYCEKTELLDIDSFIKEYNKEVTEILDTEDIEKINQEYQATKIDKKITKKIKKKYGLIIKAAILRKSVLIFFALLIPLTSFFEIVALNGGKVISIYNITSLLILNILIFFLILNGLLVEGKRKNIKLFGKKIIVLLLVIYTVYISSFIGLSMVLYGENNNCKKWFILYTRETMNHQYLASWFYSENDIDNVLNENNKHINKDKIELVNYDDIKLRNNVYKNKYEEQILTKENENDTYKIIKINGTTRNGDKKYSGYMVVVYDPSKVKVAPATNAGVDETSEGQTLAVIAKNNNAKVAINAGGFYDPDWASNGGIPHGIVISNGEFKTEFVRAVDSGGLVGFDNNNKLVLKRMTKEEALESNIRDAVDFGPYLIVNGINQFKYDNSTWYEPRTAIAQREDGIVLLLVIDGRQESSAGCTFGDVADLLMNYGAINAANMDGGTSTALVENGEYVNTPHNGKKRTIRRLPNAWIVTE